MLRRDRLCPKPEFCPEADHDESLDEPQNCAACPTVKLDEYLASPSGGPFRGALEIDFALRAGFAVTLDDVTCWEFGLLSLLDQERKRFEKQETDKITSKAHGGR